MSWSGRSDGPRDLRWHEIVQPWSAEAEPGWVCVGFACDEGVSRNQGRIGAAGGPDALRTAMSNLPATRGQLLYDMGDVLCDDADLVSAQTRFADLVAGLLEHGQRVVGLGGGHEIALASFTGLVNSGLVSKGQKVGILNLDAHFDLRLGPEPTSGNSFSNILQLAKSEGIDVEYRVVGISPASNTAGLFDRARELGVQWILDEDLNHLTLPSHLLALQAWLDSIDALYLTICLDVLPASVAPGVSAPAGRGVPLEFLEPVLSTVRCPKLRLFDVAELNPSYDIDGRTARVAARLIWKLIHEG